MTGRLDFLGSALVIGGALAAFGSGCARSVEFEPVTTSDGGTGGAGGSGGAGGATTTSSTSTTTACISAADCAYLSGPCVVGTCINGSCTTTPGNENAACDDGLYCTNGDSCHNGVCVGGPPSSCPGLDACHVGVCDEATKSCKQQPGNNGAQCDDGDACTYFGTCSNGACAKGPPIDCSFFDDICTIGVCIPGTGCTSEPKNDGFPCDDGLFCTMNDVCSNGLCTGGAPMQCAPPGGCFVGSCDEANDTCTSVAGNDGTACDDGSPCTANTTCVAGVCTNGTPQNDGAACDDGTSCTMGETCSAGACTGGQGPTIYFADDFKDASKGWILGPEWQIGPAMASIPGQGFPDPSMDHTATADNGIAGVAIGGNAQTMLHPWYYLESPAFDTANAQGSVILGFYRFLNSDYDPYMHNDIEVWDGSQWVQIWVTGPFPGIEDSEWTYISHDITAYKNAAMRIRFGFDITSGGVFTIGSWNVDDVLVASGACP